MRAIILIGILAGCGITRYEHVGAPTDAGTDATRDANGDDAAIPTDTSMATDAAPMDAAMPMDSGGGCGLVTSAGCPNVATRLALGGAPFVVSGITLEGYEDNHDSVCVDPGSSDWTLEVDIEDEGRLEVQFSAAVRFGVAMQPGGCGARATSCGSNTGMTTSTGVVAGDTVAVTVEALDACDVPFDLVVTLQPL